MGARAHISARWWGRRGEVLLAYTGLSYVGIPFVWTFCAACCSETCVHCERVVQELPSAK